MSDGVQQPVKNQSGDDQQNVTLALHERFLLMQLLCWGTAGIRRFTKLSVVFVFVVDIHEQKHGKWDDGEEWFQKAVDDVDQPFSERTKTWHREKKDHDCFCACSVP